LDGNSWSDLPPRWGKLWPGTKAVDGPRGYNVAEAVDFLYGMRVFYDTAESVWEEIGVFHYTNRLSFQDFIQELRHRLPKTWHDGLVEYVKYIYFTCKESGNFPKWYSLDIESRGEMFDRAAADEYRRELNVQKTRQDAIVRSKRMAAAYDLDIGRRSSHLSQLSEEHRLNDELLSKMALASLYHCVKGRDAIAEARLQRFEQQLAKASEEEMERLKELLDADKDGREEEWIRTGSPNARHTSSYKKAKKANSKKKLPKLPA